MSGRVANCPNCGGRISFKAGSTLLSVCAYCESVVGRAGGDITELEILGKVAPLADTGTPLSIGLRGSYRQRHFTLVGRVQLNYGQGPWNEWYALFDDQSWGWVAEAQGKVYLTFGKEMPGLPDFESAEVGCRLSVGKLDLLITERRSADVVSAEGELPFRAVPGTQVYYCDLETQQGHFGTIDYGSEVLADGEPRPAEKLFLGEELNYETLFGASVFGQQRAPSEAEMAVGLNCPNCGIAVSLRAPDAAQRVTCHGCDALLECKKGSPLFLLNANNRPGPEPLIPLGAKGTLDGTEFDVLGHLVRFVVVEGTKYAWEEYLLHHRGTGFRWLLCADRHWTFVEPVKAGEVDIKGRSVRYRRGRYRHFQTAEPVVESLRGEFYWKVEVGERVVAEDYIAPPNFLSCEKSGVEMSWSKGTYLSPEEVRAAFSLGHSLPVPLGVAPHQPNPHRASRSTAVTMGLVATLLLGVLVFLVYLTSDRKVILDHVGTLPKKAGATGLAKLSSQTSEVFEVSSRSNLAIRVSANVGAQTFFLSGHLVDQLSENMIPFGAMVGRSSPGSVGDVFSGRYRTVHLGAVPPGQYVAKYQAEYQQNRTPDQYRLIVREDVFVGEHAVVFFFLLWVVPLLTAVRAASFEKRRWMESDYAWEGGG